MSGLLDFAFGPIVGMVFLIVLPELIRPLADERLLLILVIIYLPQGIVDSLIARLRSAPSARHEQREGVRELPSA